MSDALAFGLLGFACGGIAVAIAVCAVAQAVRENHRESRDPDASVRQTLRETQATSYGVTNGVTTNVDVVTRLQPQDRLADVIPFPTSNNGRPGATDAEPA